MNVKIGANTKVSISYTIKDHSGHVLDASSLGQPLVFYYGQEAVLPGIEEALLGLSIGDTLSALEIPVNKAFGLRDPALVKTLSRNALPDDLELSLGLPLGGDNGLTWYITELSETRITLDANPPLAGKSLRADVRVVDVQAIDYGKAPRIPPNARQMAYDTADTGWES